MGAEECEARRGRPGKHRVEMPGKSYWKAQIKCQAACPVQTDARGYVRAISEGDVELAYLLARGPNPLASMCGRVCGAPCEVACRRGEVDKPIAIRALKRWACQKHGPEAGGAPEKFVDRFRRAVGRRGPGICSGQDELLPMLQSLMTSDIPKAEGVSVGIVGSGPAGLAAAHDLALLGFEVTIYEMEETLAGMLAFGVPEYRLPRELIQAEVEVIVAMGVKAVTNCQIGRHLSLPQLRERHDRVILAVGAKNSRPLPIPGADAPGVMGGVEFLRAVALGRKLSLGSQVVVIGGGNVAYDVGRTVLRQIAYDAARTARRLEDQPKVELVSLESLDEMPADDVEIIEGEEEGIARRNSLGPTEIVTDEKGLVRGVLFQKCLQVFDENRRFAPVFDAEQTTLIECKTVLVAIGQSISLDFVDGKRDGLDMTPRGSVVCDEVTGRTNADDLFIAGDLAYGTKLLIHAVASGKAVARAVYESVTGSRISIEDTQLHLAVPDYDREPDYEKGRRVEPGKTPVLGRLQGQSRPVELGFSDAEACQEAGRCLDCGINTIFDGRKCVLCGGCADVCPELCLRLVSIDKLDLNEEASLAVAHRLEGRAETNSSAILKDEKRCIRCGLCAQRCPTGAITMERFMFTEVLSCQTD